MLAQQQDRVELTRRRAELWFATLNNNVCSVGTYLQCSDGSKHVDNSIPLAVCEAM